MDSPASSDSKGEGLLKPKVVRQSSSDAGISESQERKRRDSLPPEPDRELKVVEGHIELPEENGKIVPYVGNAIRTSKYTLFSFLPKNLFEQFSRPANMYFIFIAILQSIRVISISQGRPTILLPLLFVVGVSMIKDAFEDRKRHLADEEENNRTYSRLDIETGGFVKTRSKELKVGDFLKIEDDEIYPADILQIYASAEGGYSYVETANLDGETNLKIKMVSEATRHIDSAEQLQNISLSLRCDPPNGRLDQFGGSIRVGQEKDIMLGLDNILLRGSKLRNTGHVLGMVLYSGEETKIRMNSTAKAVGRIKRSSIEQRMNRQILWMFFLQVMICVIAGITAGAFASKLKSEAVYLDIVDAPGYTGFIRFFTWFIIFAGFVPISLLVSMEMVKFLQGQFMGWDQKMSYQLDNGDYQFARAQTSGLNEELGQIQFILSDKTGTLTCNSMDFRKCVIGDAKYGSGDTDISKAAKAREEAAQGSKPRRESVLPSDNEPEKAPHVNFNSRIRLQKTLCAKLNEPVQHGSVNGDTIRHHNPNLEEEFLLSLAIGNSVFPAIEPDEDGNEKVELKASSPDEEALVEWARFIGYELYERNPPTLRVRRRVPNTEELMLEYEQLALLDFTSKRKRMTVVVRTPEGKVKLYTKGADNIVGRLLRGEEKQHEHMQFTVDTLGLFGDQGLRTLLVASAERDASWWDDNWGPKYSQMLKDTAVEGQAEVGHFKGSCQDDCRRCVMERDIEADAGLELVGATAIEDKLQDKVPDAIAAFLKAGINVWVLTGDKLETAINIGMACNLLESSMEPKGNLFRLEATSVKEVRDMIHKCLKHIESERSNGRKGPYGLVVTSDAFGRIMKKQDGENLLAEFWSLASQCKSVVGCRMQPNQKAKIVQLVKDLSPPGTSTLGVGDGANDEQMIRTADVGVGIRGVEGTTAVRASDYAISQFHFMHRLLFVHGRLSYRRITTLILYIFYKNTLICFSQFWFGCFSAFSGQPIYLEWAYQLYNVAFTAIPILVFAVLDYDIDFEKLEKNPLIYSLTSHGELFNTRIFFQWILLSLVHSLILFFFPFAIFDTHSNAADGRSDGMWSLGLVVYSAVVIVTNFKIALLMKSWTALHYISVFGSIIFYFFAIIILNLSPVFATAGGDYTWLAFRLFSTPKFWFALIFTCLAASIIDYTIEAYMQLVTKDEQMKLTAVSPSGREKSDAALLGQGFEEIEAVETKEESEDQVDELPQPAAHDRCTLVRRHTGFDFSYTHFPAGR